MRHLFLIAAVCASASAQELRMNQIQFVGTHNSYHAGLAPGEMAVLRKQNPQSADSLAYKHATIESQLDAGVRQLELDVYGDTKGGRFAHPLYLRLSAREGRAEKMPDTWTSAMNKPGIKVLHVSDVDFRSHCPTLVGCLQIVRAWSKAHPRHLPIYIQLETKIGRAQPGFVETEPWTRAALDTLDAEIRSVFAAGEVVTPDEVRGARETLVDAVLKDGWPTLDRARGKVVFLFDQESVTPLYTEGHPALRGRMVFTNAKPGAPDAAFVKVNNPSAPQIPDLVRQGYLIRTMVDGGAQAVRSGDTKRLDAGIASGAQILSTDYPFDWKAEGSGYHVTLGSETARCNPVNAPKPCVLAKPY